MKATKKIVGAACALVAAVALSAGSTFAWFTSNGEVTATGMQVNVKTDNSYMIIADTVEGLQDGNKTLDLSGLGTKPLSPSAYEADSTLTVGDEKLITKEAQWYTGQGTSATDGTLETTSKTALTAGNFDDYVIVSHIYVSVLGATPVEKINMTFKSSGFNSTNSAATNNDAISVLILYRTMVNEEGATETNWTKAEIKSADHTLGTTGIDVNTGDIDSTKYVELCVMVYFDGNNEAVTTDNQLNLTGVALSFGFTDGTTPTYSNPTYTPSNAGGEENS